MKLSSGPAAQSRHHLQTVQTTAEETRFCGNMNTALCDFWYAGTIDKTLTYLLTYYSHACITQPSDNWTRGAACGHISASINRTRLWTATSAALILAILVYYTRPVMTQSRDIHQGRGLEVRALSLVQRLCSLVPRAQTPVSEVRVRHHTWCECRTRLHNTDHTYQRWAIIQ